MYLTLTYCKDAGWAICGHPHLMPAAFLVALVGEKEGPIEAGILPRGERQARQPDREQENFVKGYWLPDEPIEWGLFWEGTEPLLLKMGPASDPNRSLFVMGEGFSASYAVPPQCKFSGPGLSPELPTAWDRIRGGT